MAKNKIVAQRNQFVVKSNEIIRARYSLTVQQQKIMLYIISKIQPTDPYDKVYTISIRELCRVCGMDETNGYYYQSIREDMLRLTQRQWGVFPNGVQKTISWIGDTDIMDNGHGDGTISVTLNKNLAPFLFELHGNYTQYRLQNALVFKHAASIRLYEILRSHTTQRKIDNGVEAEVMYKVDELRNVLAVDGYPVWADFHRYVIKMAVDEINRASDELHVEYNLFKRGRQVESVNFIISTAGSGQLLRAHAAATKML